MLVLMLLERDPVLEMLETSVALQLDFRIVSSGMNFISVINPCLVRVEVFVAMIAFEPFSFR